MRINVYSQELTSETVLVSKDGTNENGAPETFYGVRMMLLSSPMLHHNADDDDRSGITFWLPKSPARRLLLSETFKELARLIDDASDWRTRNVKEEGKK